MRWLPRLPSVALPPAADRRLCRRPAALLHAVRATRPTEQTAPTSCSCVTQSEPGHLSWDAGRGGAVRGPRLCCGRLHTVPLEQSIVTRASTVARGRADEVEGGRAVQMRLRGVCVCGITTLDGSASTS
eukprot:141912-Chlamydomonas_euryale.AAC.12